MANLYLGVLRLVTLRWCMPVYLSLLALSIPLSQVLLPGCRTIWPEATSGAQEWLSKSVSVTSVV